MRIVAISTRSPHQIIDGYTLRVKSVLEHATALSDDIHLIAPVRAQEAHAGRWCESIGIHLHPIPMDADSEWEASHRKTFLDIVPPILTTLCDGSKTESIVLVQGLQAIVDLAPVVKHRNAVADLIDEVSPRMKQSIGRNLIRMDVPGLIRSVNNYRWYRRAMVPTFQHYGKIVVVAHDDAKRVGLLAPQARAQVIPNGVRVPDAPRAAGSRSLPEALFCGVFSYEPNEEAALFIMRTVAPLVARQAPSIRLTVVGRHPTPALKAEALRHPNVELAADVADPSVFLHRASVSLCPIFSRTGIQNKVLEALGHCLPVVTTPGVKRVFDAFGPGANECMVAAQSASQFVSALISLVNDQTRRETMGKAGRAYVSRVFNWENAVRLLLEPTFSQGS